MNKLDIVVSVFNEEESLHPFHEKVMSAIQDVNYDCRIIFVNDGSDDKSAIILDELSEKHDEVAVIHLSRNFGHESAMLAGIDHSSADVVICMDADLQHPPEVIPEILEKYESGFDIVNMVRDTRKGAGLFQNFSSRLFYAIINKLSPVNFEANASDFFLISKRVVRILKKEYRERTRFIRGYTQIVGFKRTKHSYHADERAFGKSKYSFYRLLMLTSGAIVSFSRIPLHLGLIMGLLSTVLSVVVLVYSLVMKFAGQAPPGYTTLIVFISFMFAIQFFLIGILGMYIGYIFEENKKRPIYLVDKTHGLNENHVDSSKHES